MFAFLVALAITMPIEASSSKDNKKASDRGTASDYPEEFKFPRELAFHNCTLIMAADMPFGSINISQEYKRLQASGHDQNEVVKGLRYQAGEIKKQSIYPNIVEKTYCSTSQQKGIQ